MKIPENKAILILLLLFALLLFPGCGSRQGATDLRTGRNGGGAVPSVIIQPLSHSSGTDASKIINAYNTRNVGSPGWRRVIMELFTNGSVTRTFTVVNLWFASEDTVSTLFLLESPKGLSGTNYLLREWTNKTPEMRVNLFLPAGERKVLEVAPNNFDEGLLGSDFSYNDIRMQLPMRGYRYTLVGEGVLNAEPVWIVESLPSAPQSRATTSWDRADLYFARDFPFLLGADYLRTSEDSANGPVMVKQMRVDKLKQIAGSWTAIHMTMYSDQNRRSELTLNDAEFNSDTFDRKLLSPDELQVVADEVRRGWQPSHARSAKN